MSLTVEQRIAMDESAYGIAGLRGPDNRELYLVDMPSEYHGEPNSLLWHPGATWRDPTLDMAGRECWVIVLPNRAGSWWTTYEATGTQNLWSVSGTAPRLTVHPSINAGDGPGPGNWHGWIKDGVMAP